MNSDRGPAEKSLTEGRIIKYIALLEIFGALLHTVTGMPVVISHRDAYSHSVAFDVLGLSRQCHEQQYEM